MSLVYIVYFTLTVGLHHNTSLRKYQPLPGQLGGRISQGSNLNSGSQLESLSESQRLTTFSCACLSYCQWAWWTCILPITQVAIKDDSLPLSTQPEMSLARFFILDTATQVPRCVSVRPICF